MTSVGAGAATPGGAESVSAARDLIDIAIDRYEASQRYEIEFVQDTYWALADSTQTIRGILTVSTPSLISVRYVDGGRIVVNAESLWVYVPETNQFFSGPVDSSDVVIDPARLLRQYAPDPTAPLDERADGTAVVMLRPLQSAREPSSMTVEIDQRSGLLKAIAARMSTGDRTSYRILDTRFGQRIAANEFTLRRPPGAELIEGGSR
jgi:outer membrane lipoprotein-sorting protein